MIDFLNNDIVILNLSAFSVSLKITDKNSNFNEIFTFSNDEFGRNEILNLLGSNNNYYNAIMILWGNSPQIADNINNVENIPLTTRLANLEDNITDIQLALVEIYETIS